MPPARGKASPRRSAWPRQSTTGAPDMVVTELPTEGLGIEKSHRRVIFASSLGTVFEWYDFYLYGSLAAIISKQFFSGVNETTGFIFALLAFAAGFAVRPFGALVFGRLGDLVGRKYTFLDHHHHHGSVDRAGRRVARLCTDRCRRAHHAGGVADAAGPGAWVENTAARQLMSASMRLPTGAGCIRVGSRRPRPWGCS